MRSWVLRYRRLGIAPFTGGWALLLLETAGIALATGGWALLLLEMAGIALGMRAITPQIMRRQLTK